jgi:anthranilate/para-aminobenzoate synthase component I
MNDRIEPLLSKVIRKERSLKNFDQGAPNSAPSLKIDFLSDAYQYEAMVRKAKAHIKAGDIFQANLSLRFGIDWHGDGWQLYKNYNRLILRLLLAIGARPGGK